MGLFRHMNRPSSQVANGLVAVTVKIQNVNGMHHLMLQACVWHMDIRQRREFLIFYGKEKFKENILEMMSRVAFAR